MLWFQCGGFDPSSKGKGSWKLCNQRTFVHWPSKASFSRPGEAPSSCRSRTEISSFMRHPVTRKGQCPGFSWRWEFLPGGDDSRAGPGTLAIAAESLFSRVVMGSVFLDILRPDPQMGLSARLLCFSIQFPLQPLETDRWAILEFQCVLAGSLGLDFDGEFAGLTGRVDHVKL